MMAIYSPRHAQKRSHQSVTYFYISTVFFFSQSSSSSHCGSIADEPDTRSSPGAGHRYPDDNPADCTSTLGNPIKNNGYERSASATEEMMDRLNNERDQGAEGTYHKKITGKHGPPPKFCTVFSMWPAFSSLPQLYQVDSLPCGPRPV